MTLSLVQSVAYMSLAVGGASDIVGTPANLGSDLAVFLEGGIAPNGSRYNGFFPQNNADLAGGDWSVVWGPVVILPPGSTQDFAANSMYVAYSPSQATYVVAVAGTDFDSVYDWFAEDADVLLKDMMSWPPGSSGNAAMISGATSTGLANLQGMTNSKGQTLSQYIQTVESENATLIFTGHSLGGALSPTLAFALYDDPGSSGWNAVYVLALAGPTPGNQAFATAFNSAYGKVSTGSSDYPSWNANYQNTRDLVPRAWNRLQSVMPLPNGNWKFGTIWGWPSFGMRIKIKALIEDAQTLLDGAKYWRINAETFGSDATWGYFVPGPTFPGTGSNWSPTWYSWPQYTITNPIGSDTLLEQLISSSHLDQYYSFFQIVPLQPLPLSASQLAAKRTAELKRRMALSAARISADADAVGTNVEPHAAAEVDAQFDEVAGT